MAHGHDGLERRMKKHSGVVVDKRCTLYTSPAAQAKVPSFSDITLTWDPTCLTTSLTALSTSGSLSKIDIYFYVSDAPVHAWSSLPFSQGSLLTSFDARWWAADAVDGIPSAQEGYLVFSPTGTPVSMTPFAVGPPFEVDFNGTVPASAIASGAPPAYTGPAVESTSDAGSRAASGGLGGGKLAAAVVMPLLVVAAVVGGYVFWTRRKTSTDRKRWSAYVDDRMSVISGATWKDGAPRPSLAHSRAGSVGGMSVRTGASTPGPSHLRNGSTYLPDGTARPTSSIYAGTLHSPIRPSFQQHRASMSSASKPGDRTSRISFAADGLPNPGSPAGGKRRSIYSGRGTGLPALPADAAARSSYYANVSHGTSSPSPLTGSTPLGEDQTSSGGTIPLWMRFSTHGKGVGGHVANTSVGSIQPPMPAHFGAVEALRGNGEDDQESLDEKSLLDTPRKPPPLPLKTDLSDLANSPSQAVRGLARMSAGSMALPQEPTTPASMMNFNMPRAQRDSTLSPDDAMARYALNRQGSGPPSATPSSPERENAGALGGIKAMIRKKSNKNLRS